MEESKGLEKVESSKLFLFLWSCVNLFDQISSSETFLYYHLGEIYLPLVIAISFSASLAFIVFDLRTAIARQVILLACFTQILLTLAVAPECPNHRFLAAAVNLSLVAEILRTKSLVLSSRFTLTAKCLTSMVYGFAFFHKLNSDYLNPTTSCAAQFVGDLIGYYPNFGFLDYFREQFTWIGLLIEAFLAIILFLPASLSVAVVAAGFVFHSFLALHIERHFFDFSSLMMTLLLLFVPSTKAVGPPIKSIRWILGVGFFAAYFLLLDLNHPFYVLATVQIRNRLWMIFSVLITYVALRRAMNLSKLNSKMSQKEIGKFNVTVLLFLLSTGMTPYLGLKTRYAFDMYSNLQVEDRYSNHLIIPRTLQLGILTDDLVEVIRTKNIEKFYPRVRPDVLVDGARIVRFQLMAIMARAPGLSVVVRENGIEREITSATEVYPNGWVAPWILRKLLGFRPVKTLDSRAFCQW